MKIRRMLMHALLLLLAKPVSAQVNDTLARYINKRLANFHSFEAVIVTEQQMSALSIYEKGVKANSDKHYDEAIQTLQEAIAIDSSGNCGSGMNGAAFNEMGYAYSRLFKKDSALICLERAIRFNPKHPKAYVNKIFLLVNLKRREEALSTLDEMIRQMPEFTAGAPLKGWLLQQAGDAIKARKEYQHFLANIPPAEDDAEGNALQAMLSRLIQELPEK